MKIFTCNFPPFKKCLTLIKKESNNFDLLPKAYLGLAMVCNNLHEIQPTCEEGQRKINQAEFKSSIICLFMVEGEETSSFHR